MPENGRPQMGNSSPEKYSATLFFLIHIFRKESIHLEKKSEILLLLHTQ